MESVDGASGGLDAAMLYARCDPAGFGFETTAELEDLEGAIGQARAVNAVRFGVEVGREGYNVFALGPPGTGKRTLVERFVEDRAAGEPARMGSTARAISVGAPELALIVGRAARPDSSVVVLYDGSPVSERALALAADLAGKRDVKIMIPTDETRDTRSLSAQAEWRMAERGIPASFVELPSGGVAAFARAVNREDAGLLVVPGDTSAEAGAALAGLVEEVECPVLVVR